MKNGIYDMTWHPWSQEGDLTGSIEYNVSSSLDGLICRGLADPQVARLISKAPWMYRLLRRIYAGFELPASMESDLQYIMDFVEGDNP